MIYYIYDDSGSLIGFKYNNEIYYYQKNYQNDITGIYDSSYNLVVIYKYDGWGKVLSVVDNTTNNIGSINPFRYRSYYYDEETSLYYLNSRYYNPKWCRFINADGIIGANQDILSLNLYAYVSNNPTTSADIDGTKKGFFANLWEGCKKFGKNVKNFGISIYSSINSSVQTTLHENKRGILNSPIGNRYDKIYSETSVKRNTNTGKIKSKINIVNDSYIGTSTDYGMYEKGSVTSRDFIGETHRISNTTLSLGISPSERSVRISLTQAVIKDSNTTIYAESGTNISLIAIGATVTIPVAVSLIGPYVLPILPLALLPALA